MTWKIHTSIVEFEDLADFGRLAKRERLSFKKTNDTTWFGLYFDDELVGFGGLIWPTKARNWARLKSDLIVPEWRGCGGYKPLVNARIAHAFANGAEYCQVITRHRQAFERWGWHQVGPKKSLYQLDRMS